MTFTVKPFRKVFDEPSSMPSSRVSVILTVHSGFPESIRDGDELE